MAKKLGRVEECTQEDDVVLLDDRMLQTPGIALQSTVTEIVRMGNIVAETLKESKEVLFTKSEETIKSIKEKESVVDKLSAGIMLLRSQRFRSVRRNIKMWHIYSKSYQIWNGSVTTVRTFQSAQRRCARES